MFLLKSFHEKNAFMQLKTLSIWIHEENHSQVLGYFETLLMNEVSSKNWAPFRHCVRIYIFGSNSSNCNLKFRIKCPNFRLLVRYKCDTCRKSQASNICEGYMRKKEPTISCPWEINLYKTLMASWWHESKNRILWRFMLTAEQFL